MGIRMDWRCGITAAPYRGAWVPGTALAAVRYSAYPPGSQQMSYMSLRDTSITRVPR